MPSFQPTLVHCPTGHAIAVMNLRQRDPRGHDNVFHVGSVLNGYVRILIQRFDQNALTLVRQARADEGTRVFRRQQSGLDTDAAG